MALYRWTPGGRHLVQSMRAEADWSLNGRGVDELQ
jgi:hypothetical protein